MNVVGRHDHRVDGVPRFEESDVAVGPLEAAVQRVGRQLLDGVCRRQVSGQAPSDQDSVL